MLIRERRISFISKCSFATKEAAEIISAEGIPFSGRTGEVEYGKHRQDWEAAVMADLFEASFIEVIQGLAEKNSVKKGAFARLVWPDSTPLWPPSDG